MRDFGRDLRIADVVREELAHIVQRRLRDPRLREVRVNDVRMSGDLSVADVYVTSLGVLESAEQAAMVAVLNRASGFFRSELARRDAMRATPQLRFHYDVSVERGSRLDQLITEAVAADRRAHSHG